MSVTKTEKLLCELIALPSVNPAFLPPNDSHAGEQRVAEFLAASARRAGLEIELQPVLPARSNLLIWFRPQGKVDRRLLLAPHLDTVSGAELPGAFFSPAISNGRLFGRGACDTKGSVAAMFTALCLLAESTQRPARTEIVLACLVDEESGQAGSRALAASGFRADLAIVGEPTKTKIVTAHKGALWLRLTTRGKAAHGARPELGRNAIHAMARVVDLLETRYAAALRRRRAHPLLGHASINVGAILGGKQPNIVPDECAIQIDRRTLPGENDSQVVREINTLLRQNRLSAQITSLQNAPCGPMETSLQSPLLPEFFRSARQKRPVGVDYFSDAGVLSAAGIPSVLFGPGDIAQAHTPDEWIGLEQLERGKEMLLRFFKTLQ
jgi:acetylornithine deacetylase/succinyl-diaminopimelate desuccinylase-like protein